MQAESFSRRLQTPNYIKTLAITTYPTYIQTRILIMTPSLKSRAQGAIWGTCVGDALGGPVQFADFGSFEEVKDLLPIYPFNMPVG